MYLLLFVFVFRSALCILQTDQNFIILNFCLSIWATKKNNILTKKVVFLSFMRVKEILFFTFFLTKFGKFTIRGSCQIILSENCLVITSAENGVENIQKSGEKRKYLRNICMKMTFFQSVLFFIRFRC